jgi:hypothetical protein
LKGFLKYISVIGIVILVSFGLSLLGGYYETSWPKYVKNSEGERIEHLIRESYAEEGDVTEIISSSPIIAAKSNESIHGRAFGALLLWHARVNETVFVQAWVETPNGAKFVEYPAKDILVQFVNDNSSRIDIVCYHERKYTDIFYNSSGEEVYREDRFYGNPQGKKQIIAYVPEGALGDTVSLELH